MPFILPMAETMDNDRLNSQFRNFLGAFADGAILFPLIASLSVSSGFSSVMLLGSVGVIYILAGSWFQIPMSVQPLKTIAIAAIVSGANSLEVRLAGAMVGIFCLSLWVLKPDRLADRIPKYLIHGIQAGLGLMLLRRSVESGFEGFSQGTHSEIAVILFGFITAWILGKIIGLPILGLIATIGTLIGISRGRSISVSHSDIHSIRWTFVLALALPQLVLTTANSVLGTYDAAKRYFGKSASRTTISRLLASIGLGNLAISLVGGLPFCHGSGGLTAHYRGGSNHWSSNLFIGGFCLFLAGIQFYFGGTTLNYPPLLLSLLLGVVGYYHFTLASPSWKVQAYRPALIVMGMIALMTQNLLWSLAFGLAIGSLSQFLLSKWMRYDFV